MSSVGQRVNEEKNAAKKPADALAKALKSSAFWKVGITITWIVGLYEHLNIIVNVHLSLSAENTRTLQITTRVMTGHISFFL